MTHNPYAALSQKKFRGDPTRLVKDNSSETKEKSDKPLKKPATKVQDKKLDAGQPNDKKREQKVITLKEENLTIEPTRPSDPSPPTKKERELKDKHEDRSGKGDRERKSGVGVGGWSDDLASQIREGEKEVHDRTEHIITENDENPAEKKEEEDKPTMTVDEYRRLKAERNKHAQTTFVVRKVDASQLKGLVQAKRNDEDIFKIQKAELKLAPKTVADSKKSSETKNVEAMREDDDKAKKDKSELELGFKYKSGGAARGRGGRGRARGEESGVDGESDQSRKGRGEVRSRGGRGRGYEAADEPVSEKTGPILKDTDFPAL